MAAVSSIDEPIWDGNGGTLDPKKAPQRDLLVALHVKMDQVVIPALKELNDFRRSQESGELTKAQRLAIGEVFQADQDAVATRRSLKLPVWALIVSCLALAASVVYTIASVNGGHL